MKICPTCGEVYGDQVAHCTSDGQALTDSSGNVPVKEWAVPLGSVVGGYRLVDRLGKGGMGVVYRAEHQRLGKKVAIKMLRPDLVADRALVQRFFDEARAATRIGHDGIVEIFDFIEEGEQRCYVMELLEGHAVSAELDNKPMPPERVVTIGVQVASALAAAHDAGVIHRDLKPDNVFLRKSSDGGVKVKLLDFGIAKLKESDDAGASLTQTGVVLGTPAYMSPEQLEGLKIDARSDIYALGVLLYEMATGMRPFRGRTVAEVVLKHVRDAPVPPSQAGGVPLPFALETTILACLEKDRERRPQTMKDVISLLEEVGPRTTVLPAATPATPTGATARAHVHTGATQPVSTGKLSTGELASVRSPLRVALWAIGGVVVVALLGAGTWVGATRLMAARREASGPPVVATDPALPSAPPAPDPPAPPVEPAAATPATAPAPEPPVAAPVVTEAPMAEPPPAASAPAPKKPAAAKPLPRKPASKKPTPKPPKRDTLVDPFG
ncbi:MAG: serine/threonine protein kinase [Deltaproteobacteria bacterium]|nr:serine/threonine protein kinase [Deltaproteobacteria bacterium]